MREFLWNRIASGHSIQTILYSYRQISWISKSRNDEGGGGVTEMTPTIENIKFLFVWRYISDVFII